MLQGVLGKSPAIQSRSCLLGPCPSQGAQGSRTRMNLTHLVLPAFPSMLSQTLKQMKAFQGAIRYCRMQLPDYSVLTMLLKQALKEMQSQEFTRVEWIPGSQHTFQKPEKSLTQTPALGLPSQTKFHLYIAERQGTAPGNNVRSISSSQTDS